MNAELQSKITMTGIEYKAENLIDRYRDQCENLSNYLTDAGYTTLHTDVERDIHTFRQELWKLIYATLNADY